MSVQNSALPDLKDLPDQRENQESMVFQDLLGHPGRLAFQVLEFQELME